MSVQRQVVLIGLDGVGSHVFHTLPTGWHITVVDSDLTRLNNLPDVHGERRVTKICDNPSSKLVLDECNLQRSTLLAIMTTSDTMNQEVLRVVKEHFNVESIFVVQNSAETHCDVEGVIALNPEELLTNRLSNYLRGTMSAAGIGQERGEIRQITILTSSSARGRSLASLHPDKWLAAAIYRDGELIVPHGDTIFRAGDDVVIVGEPDILDREASFLRGGQIIFPSQYGTTLGVMDAPDSNNLVALIGEKTEVTTTETISFTALDPDSHSEAEIRSYVSEHDIGLIVLPPKPISWVARWGFRPSKIMTLMFAAQLPFWVDNKPSEIKKILLCIKNEESLSVVATVAMDIARQFEAEMTLLTVMPPNSSQERRKHIEELPNQVQHLGRSHGVELQVLQKEGNPIKEIIQTSGDYDLVIVGYSEHRLSTFNNPDISLHIFHDSQQLANTSVLFLPWQTAGGNKG